jgi:hypothetical protein
MGIDHRLTDNQTFWRCPTCDAVAEVDPDIPKDVEQECVECSEKHLPRYNHAFWHEFSEYCRRLKDG